MKHLQSTITKLTEYKDLLKSVPDDKKKNNIGGSCLNRILCYYENLILNVCKKTIMNKNIEVAVNMFDGCMVYGDYYNQPELLNEIKEEVDKSFEGLNMVWAYKEHVTQLKYLMNGLNLQLLKIKK